MAKFDRKLGVLKHTHSKFWDYPLQDIKEPNLIRETFPYEEVPRIDFDGRILPVQPAEEIYITDTTFRDGQQSRPPYTAKQILTLYNLMHELGGPNGVIRQSEFFLYSDKDKRAVELCLAQGHKFPEVTGWIRANPKDFELVKSFGLKETGILTSVSDYHIFLKMKKSRKKVMAGYLDVVRLALEQGIRPRCHFEDVTRADIFGFVVPFARELMKLREQAGIDVRIRLCDTMGFGVTYPGASMPRSVDKLVRTMIDEAGVPGELLEWHGHNDFHKVLINASTAWLYGCAAANGTLLGFGERTGNPPIEGMIMEYMGLRGDSNGINTRIITEIARYIEEEMGISIPKNYPFVGARFNVTAAGIHIDGMLRNEEIYNIFNTDKILDRPMGIVITDKSGMAGIAQWINSYLRLPEERRLSKRHPGVAKINSIIREQFEEGRVAGISDEEMEAMARKYVPNYFVGEFDRIKKRAGVVAMHLAERLVDLPQLGTMKTKTIEPILHDLVARLPMVQFAYVADLNGRLITHPITQPEDKAAYDNIHIADLDFSNREWFRKALTEKRVAVFDPFTSWITHRLTVTVSAPITNRKGDVAGVLGIDLSFDALSKVEDEEEEVYEP